MTKIDKLLASYKIFPGRKGYEYIVDILSNKKYSPIAKMNITDIYEKIAKKNYCKTSAIEHCIRICIKNSSLPVKSNKLAIAMLQNELL